MSVRLFLRVVGTSSYQPEPDKFIGKVHVLQEADETRGDQGFTPMTYRATKAVVQALNARGDFTGAEEIEISGAQRQYGKQTEIHLTSMPAVQAVPKKAA